MSTTEPLPDLARQGGAHVAKIHGEPLLELPRDLYIPPEALEVFLDTFEGPLDLLLYLIRRQNINVLEIPMAELTRQYLGYVEMMRRTQLELAAEYLLMAAVLIEIKSRLLLPKPPALAGDDAADPRAELVRRLLEYEQMKKAAQLLGEAPVAGRDFSVVEVYIEQSLAESLPGVAIGDLSEAWRSILARAKMTKHHKITREQLSVRSHMSRILRELGNGAFTEFSRLFKPEEGVPVLVVSFLALLELARESLIEITQQGAFDPIYVRMKSERAALTIT